MKANFSLLLLFFVFAPFWSDLRASIAYGSINNFDTVNDTGHECHGFEIEIEDCRTTDITYTYNYNHYGVPRFEQDDTDPAHPKCRIRWESKRSRMAPGQPTPRSRAVPSRRQMATCSPIRV